MSSSMSTSMLTSTSTSSSLPTSTSTLLSILSFIVYMWLKKQTSLRQYSIKGNFGETLVDILHPKEPNVLVGTMCDVVLMACYLVALVKLVYFNQYRLIGASLRNITLLTFLYGIFQYVTILPPARGEKACFTSRGINVKYRDGKITESTFKKYFSKSMFALHGCHDMIASNHTAGYLLSINALLIGSPWEQYKFPILSGVAVIATTSLTQARYHYTIDCLVSVVITMLMMSC